MRTRLLSALMLLLTLLPAGTAAAHGAAHHERLEAGPYRLELEYNIWPLRAHSNVDLLIYPEGGGAGKAMIARVIPPAGTSIAVRTVPVTTHPTASGAYTIHSLNLAAPGDWKIEFNIDGPAGQGKGTTAILEVEGAVSGLPPSAGWVISLVPLAALIGFFLREQRRVSEAMAADGGARA